MKTMENVPNPRIVGSLNSSFHFFYHLLHLVGWDGFVTEEVPKFWEVTVRNMFE